MGCVAAASFTSALALGFALGALADEVREVLPWLQLGSAHYMTVFGFGSLACLLVATNYFDQVHLGCAEFFAEHVSLEKGLSAGSAGEPANIAEIRYQDLESFSAPRSPLIRFRLRAETSRDYDFLGWLSWLIPHHLLWVSVPDVNDHTQIVSFLEERGIVRRDGLL